MAKPKKMTPEEDARQQANIDRLRELLERNGGTREGVAQRPKPQSER